jgi:hypothetical protein
MVVISKLLHPLYEFLIWSNSDCWVNLSFLEAQNSPTFCNVTCLDQIITYFGIIRHLDIILLGSNSTCIGLCRHCWENSFPPGLNWLFDGNFLIHWVFSTSHGLYLVVQWPYICTCILEHSNETIHCPLGAFEFPKH